MSDKKEVKEVKKSKDSDVIASISRRLDKVVKWVEEIHGADIDGDGKVGSVKISLISIIAVFGLAISAFAAEEIMENWPAPEATDAVLVLSADEGDDAADIGELIMTTSGAMKIDVGGTTAATFSTAGITVTTPVEPTSVITTTNLTITSTYYGKAILLNTNAAMNVTLPANGAAVGSWFEVSIIGDNNCAPTISAATADTLIGPNDVDLDSVTWATANRINATAKFWSDGSFWHVQNLGGTTMTYTD